MAGWVARALPISRFPAAGDRTNDLTGSSSHPMKIIVVLKGGASGEWLDINKMAQFMGYPNLVFPSCFLGFRELMFGLLRPYLSCEIAQISLFLFRILHKITSLVSR